MSITSRRVGPTATHRLQGSRWNVTAPYWEQCDEEGGLVTRPAATAHAKEMGTMTTACGLWADSWPKMLDLPFPVPTGTGKGADMCRVCLAKVIEEW